MSYQRGAPENNFAFAPDNDDGDRAAKALQRALLGTILLIFAAPAALVLVAEAVRRTPRAKPGARTTAQS